MSQQLKSEVINILYCTDSLMAGGTEQQLVELVTRLDRQRFVPHVICLYGSRANRSLHFLNVLETEGVSVILLDLDWSAKSKALGVMQLIREIWRLRPQIVQAVNYHSNLLLRLARPFLPHLSLIGCIFVEYSYKQMCYERLSNWLCSAMVCNSNFLREQIQNFAPHGHVFVIPNGIDLTRYSFNTKGSSLQAKERVLLVMGRVAKQKAPHLVVDALGLLKQQGSLPPDIRLWIVGEREDIETQALIDHFVKYHRLHDVILQYPPTLTPEAYIHKAEVVILSSLWEGLPSTAIEALTAGKPVIISEAANLSGIIRNSANGWIVRTGDVEHLAEVINMVLALPSSALDGMGFECRKSSLAYDVIVMMRQYEKLYALFSTRS